MKNTLPILSVILSVVLITLFCPAYTVQESAATQPQNLKEADNAGMIKHLGNLPAFFIENRGQTAEEVRYYFKGSDTVYFTDGAVVFQKIEATNKNRGTRHSTNSDNNTDAEPLQGVAYRLEFIGANSTTPRARKQLGGRVNYFIGNDPSKWHNNIPTYREIVYPGLYGGQKDVGCVSTHKKFSHSVRSEESPNAKMRLLRGPAPRNDVTSVIASEAKQSQGENTAFSRGDSCSRPNRAGASSPERIPLGAPSAAASGHAVGGCAFGAHDPAPTPPQAAQNDIPGGMIDLVYKGVKGGMKYEFIVHPGADPGVIKMSYTGIEGLSIDESGNLIIHTALGDVNDEKPYCYQDIDGKRVEVATNFKILDSTPVIAGTPKVDALSASGTARPLQTKDKGQPQGVAPTVDMIIPSKPDTRLAGPLMPSAIRGLDAVNKNDLGMATETLRSAQGDIVQGNHSHQGRGILSSRTSETSSPLMSDTTTTSPLRGEGRVGVDNQQFIYAFEVASYDTDYPLIIDPGLEYSTFLGGSDADRGYGIAVDSSGSAYVTGYTQSSGFPTTVGAYDTSYNGGSGGNEDVFVAKINPAGSGASDLEYSTYLGGSSTDIGYGIAVDSSGRAYVTGYTASSGFPTTDGAYDESHNNNNDVFMTKLNSTGSGLSYSTFLGGGWHRLRLWHSRGLLRQCLCDGTYRLQRLPHHLRGV